MSVTSHYARAMADVLMTQRDPNAGMAELRSIADILASNASLRHVWETPSIPAEQKRGLLDAIAAKAQLGKPVRNFMAVLIDHHRVPMLEQILKQLDVELAQRMAAQQQVVDAARRALAEAAKQRKIMDKLKERQHDRWKHHNRHHWWNDHREYDRWKYDDRRQHYRWQHRRDLRMSTEASALRLRLAPPQRQTWRCPKDLPATSEPSQRR